ncbi:hypothetical protein [Sorangium sp. So ce341]|uniref:PD-(D/E)XK nuclease domain-containing protein n=1 Tax=Sorangium sp. So ce341 TaxID=3133302 RepID=UPI003F63C58D
MNTKDLELISRRIKLLQEFRNVLISWFNGSDKNEKARLRSHINLNLVAVKQAIREAGVAKRMTMGPPPALGGAILRNVDPLDMLFQEYYGMSIVPDVVDMLEEAVGVYENLRSDSGLVRLASVAETVEIESAIERALRPSFRAPPEKERDVQDAIEVILAAIGVKFTRDQDTAPVGARAFKPDFVVPAEDLAIEVKLTGPKLSESDAQEQLSADIAAYRTRWKRLLAVIYDCGAVRDPARMRSENMTHFGVRVLIVKH